MKTYRTLIVEDEPLAAEVLEDYIRQTPQLEWAGTCEDALYALDFLRRQTIDLIFLDIHLPKLKGLDFLRSLPQAPAVILTTAYHQYALESYELNVLDYLLKPIEFERFLKAVHKLDTLPAAVQQVPVESTRPFRLISVNKKQVKVFFDEILYIESLKEYVHIHTTSGQWLTQLQLGQAELFFSSAQLLRIHRSYLVAVDKVRAFSPTEVEIGKVRLPIGRTYKQIALKVLAEGG